MPTERFYNLPEEKRRRITSAALDELARVPYESLSINRIIHKAGIPRGSFYQYFADKGDLLCHLMHSFTAELRGNIKSWLVECDGDIFQVMNRVLAYTIRFGSKPENVSISRNLFAHLRLDESALPQAVQLNADVLMAEFGEYIPMERYKLESPQDISDFLEALVVMLRRAIVRAFAGSGAHEAAMASFNNQMQMLKHGILK